MEYDFHSLHCVYRNRLLTFSHIILETYLGAMRRSRYNGVRFIQDHVIMELQCIFFRQEWFEHYLELDRMFMGLHKFISKTLKES